MDPTLHLNPSLQAASSGGGDSTAFTAGNLGLPLGTIITFGTILTLMQGGKQILQRN
jgi:hypothetical protein